MSEVTVALIGGCGAMLGWGASDFFAKKTIDEVGDLTTLFWGQLVGAVGLLIGLVARHNSMHYDAARWTLLATFGVISGLSYLLLYRGFAKGQVSVLSPIFASYAGVAALMTALLFHEPLPLAVKIAIPILFIGIILMAFDPTDLLASLRDHKASGGVMEVVLAMLVFAGWLTLWDRFLNGQGWLPATLIMRSVAVATLLVVALATRHRLTVPNRRLWVPLLAIGLCDVGAYAALSYGFANSSLGSVVALLSGAFSLPTIVLARAFLKERLTMIQAVAAAIIIGGIALVAVAA
jgi:drug/metabolite transporter (DMT)-like permease